MSRRQLLIGGGAGIGLLVAWSLWPRHYAPSLRAAPGETIFNAFLKIGNDGRVVVAVPQAELGQGVFTALPQILADELGADWRTVSVEPAPISPVYGNEVLAQQLEGDASPSFIKGVADWAAHEVSRASAPMMTGGSTSVRAFEQPMRDAGAAARALLAKAAAERWRADWDSLEVHSGFVWKGKERLSFGELAARAARLTPPQDLPFRGGSSHRLTGEPLPRLDVPAKIDGSAAFAADVRLPDMLFASVRQGPYGDTRLVRFDRAAAQKVPGLAAIVQRPNWVAAVASNWWAANRAVEAMRPRFETRGGLADDAAIGRALDAALKGRGSRIASIGDTGSDAPGLLSAAYSVGPAPSAALEPLAATARVTDGQLEVWAPTQAPTLARSAAARALGIPDDRVTLYPMLGGGGYGRKLETAAIEQAAIIAMTLKRPVQLCWSRIEETYHDSFRAPARALLSARLGRTGGIESWHARIAAPASGAETAARLRGKTAGAPRVEAAAVAGALPPYAIANVLVEHCPAAVGMPTGSWRSEAHSYTAFFTESFVDELARRANAEPLSFRMQMLGDNPRLARVLATAGQLGGWDGGAPGSAKGVAAHAAFGSFCALVVDIQIDTAQRIRVVRAVCAVDCGRVVNPDLVKQQVEGAIIFGIAAATGRPISVQRGLPTAVGFGDLGLPGLAALPDVQVELLPSEEDSGGVTELGVPLVAPAIANALFALTGRRVRSLPLAVA